MRPIYMVQTQGSPTGTEVAPRQVGLGKNPHALLSHPPVIAQTTVSVRIRSYDFLRQARCQPLSSWLMVWNHVENVRDEITKARRRDAQDYTAKRASSDDLARLFCRQGICSRLNVMVDSAESHRCPMG
jgi:hypothetical protein